MEQYERAQEAAQLLREKMKTIPDTAIVLGSGLGAFARSLTDTVAIPYSEIPHFPVSTVAGHEGKLIFGRAGEKRVIVMQGRFHLYEGYSIDDVTLYVRVFQLLGVCNLILTNAAGAINLGFRPGDMMLILDHISLFCPSPLFGHNDDRFGTRFPSMTEVYDKELISIARAAAEKTGISLHAGTYCYTRGPMFETPAEIRALRTLGADACGMSTVAEAITAVHGGMRVMGLSCMTNMAAGILGTALTHQEVMETGEKISQKFCMLITEVCRVL